MLIDKNVKPEILFTKHFHLNIGKHTHVKSMFINLKLTWGKQ